ncbi:carbon starvation protein A [Candidatus Poribacteria bacterium]|nr:carbon starvation protein A [Candidatus Poribacteria bacterium]
MISHLVLIVVATLLLGYVFQGRFLARRLNVDDPSPTPACQINDGVDYVPAKPALLLGQHFSAIAAAGPIVGPILACLWFGWLPALLWIILGAIFIGGTHDFCSLVSSLRHKAASIGEIVKEHMSATSHRFFLIFVWLTLLYVIIAFTDITAHTFKTMVGDVAFGPAVAASSFLYLMVAVAMGILLYRLKVSLSYATIIFLPVTLFVIWVGPHLPAQILTSLSAVSIKQWNAVILLYCLVASLIPLWLLLQPRGYLGGWFLYLIIIIGLMGALFGHFRMEYPALNLTGFKSSVNGKAIFPILFITVACGACSGFHGVVSSGTTSKQISKYKDSLVIGYGAMLLEGLVAVLAMATVIMLPKGADMLKSDPNIIYANGIAQYLGLIRIDYQVALAFALLAFSTFVYDTLDVCTRLARYILQELTGWQSKAGGFVAAVISLIIPFIFLLLTKEKGYLVAWPIFGASNQLLASLTLLAISVWLIKTGKNPIYTILPMLFMLIMTIWSLFNLTIPFIKTLSGLTPGKLVPDVVISGVCGIILLCLSLVLVWEAARTLFLERGKGKGGDTNQTPGGKRRKEQGEREVLTARA